MEKETRYFYRGFDVFPVFWGEGTCDMIEEMLLWVGFFHRKSYSVSWES